MYRMEILRAKDLAWQRAVGRICLRKEQESKQEQESKRLSETCREERAGNGCTTPRGPTGGVH